MRKFVAQSRFHDLASRGDADGAGVVHLARVERTLDDGSRTVRFCLSDGTIDRMGDSINVQGWVTTAYMRNPVVLWSHNAQEPPIGRMRRIFVANERLMGDVEFAGPHVYPFADQIYRLVDEGYIRAGSVGFVPLEWEYVNRKDGTRGVDFERQELLEFSVVPVPANANALIEARGFGSAAARRYVREPSPAEQIARLITIARLRQSLPPRRSTLGERLMIAHELRSHLKD